MYDIAMAGIAAFVFVCAGIGLVTVIAMRRRKPLQGNGAGQAAIQDQLTHLQTAVDAMAVEIERISEGQRFTTKLLSDRPQASLPDRGTP
jgi:hypothetical protein